MTNKRHTEACYTCKFGEFDSCQHLDSNSDKIYLCKNKKSSSFGTFVSWYYLCDNYEFKLPLY